MEATEPETGDLPAFDEANPAAYYLADNQEEMEALSDATLVAGGVPLPVHSQVEAAGAAVCGGGPWGGAVGQYLSCGAATRPAARPVCPATLPHTCQASLP